MSEQYKHDGKLDNRNPCAMGHAECKMNEYGVYVEAISGHNTMLRTYLDPQQALSLLAFLFERKDELETLAKEQAE